VSQHSGHWTALGLILLLLVAAIDFATGFQLRLTIMYLVALLVLTWVMGRLFGVLLSVVACASWAYLDAIGGHYADNPSLLYWDWGVVMFGFVIMVIALTELRNALDDAQFESRKDALTGLVNKGGFYQVVGAEIEVCRRYKRTLSIAYIDCDNFKIVNDKFGHHVGDQLLQVISKTMLRKLRSSDLPGRLGGDEFAVMLPETNAEACRMVIEMLQQRLLHEMNEHDWPVTFSIGIATFLTMPPSIEEMIQQADKLMYAVKNSSKGAIKQEVFHA
jgi:diguanylate cyclase (GGDEF)-like protein